MMSAARRVEGGVEFEELVATAHAARADHRFADAYAAFNQAADLGTLSAEDYVAWSDAAWWIGRSDHCLELSEIAHRLLVAGGMAQRAAKEALGLGFLLLLRGELAAGSGWIQRGRSILEAAPESSDRGYVVQMDAEGALAAGDSDRAIDLARQARELGRQGQDQTLVALALMTEGTAVIRAGGIREGMAMLDEAMLPVRSGHVAPEFAGNLYCQMIAICWELADLDRARQWTEATERWCQEFDSAVMFSGICRMHRVQLRQVAGDWDHALAEARLVCTELVDMNVAVVAEGHYLVGDILRLRGDHEGAEAAYLRAHELGRDPQPGLALLRMQIGQIDSAVAGLRSSLAASASGDPAAAPLLRAMVDVALAAEAREEAVRARDDLTALADTFTTDGLQAAAAQARGTVEIALDNPGDAINELRDAVRRWQQLGARYDCALARVRLGQACRLLGDEDTAEREFETAARVFAELGAAPNLVAPPVPARRNLPGGLTAREAEILVCVAAGGTNLEIAGQLFISERTVARHLANIYPKIGVSTRTAAAAWARDAGIA